MQTFKLMHSLMGSQCRLCLIGDGLSHLAAENINLETWKPCVGATAFDQGFRQYVMVMIPSPTLILIWENSTKLSVCIVLATKKISFVTV